MSTRNMQLTTKRFIEKGLVYCRCHCNNISLLISNSYLRLDNLLVLKLKVLYEFLLFILNIRNDITISRLLYHALSQFFKGFCIDYFCCHTHLTFQVHEKCFLSNISPSIIYFVHESKHMHLDRVGFLPKQRKDLIV